MKKKSFSIFLTLVFVAFFSLKLSCQNKTNLPNIASFYNPSLTTLHPKYKLHNKAEGTSTVYSYIYLPELNFVRLGNNTFEGKIEIKYLFYESLESTYILDSASKTVVFQKTNIKESVITYFDVKPPVSKCKLIIITKDLYNSKKSLNIIDIDKENNSEQNFLLMDSETFKPVFTEYVVPNRPYKIKYNKDCDSFLVSKFLPDTTLAASPFSAINSNYTPKLDSQFYVKKLTDFTITKSGIYSFENTLNNENFTIVCFTDQFPLMTSADEMIPPLKYLCTSKEYKDINVQINKKLALDNFWLSTNKEPAIAKSLIKIYYNRVLYTNTKFTSTREGWKTDRGMIYIIFGPPEVLHIGDNYEEWIYVDGYAGKEVIFTFDRKQNDYTSNDYVLRRNISFNYYWKDAVSTWKKGNLYVF
ncbi:MAG: GWxTD domain-containing protein [Bacteroidales bacterium]|nr:GWxTD domain-containing protein [Bacteroidales bacterium]